MSEQGAPFQGGFRVFSVGRDAAQRFRVRAPWRVREGAGSFERALVGTLTFLLALPVALLLLGLGVLLLVLFLGCAAVFVAFALAMWLVRRIFGVGSSRNSVFRGRASVPDERENVRVLPRQDPHP